jgi:predicted esterase
MKEKYIIIDNQKIFYRENISKPDDKNILFFMHGWGASSDLFLQIFPKNKN